MDYTAYFRELADYYNCSRIPSKVMTGATELRAEFNQPGSWVRECGESLQATLAKRRVLEIACGSGRWTQFVADVAERVVATDPCPRLLDYGRRLNLPNTDWLECDAFSLHKVEGTFDGACHINFMNHVPRELLPKFIDELHCRLEPDAVVFCASQRWQGSAEEPWYEKPETGDMVSLRHHSHNEVVIHASPPTVWRWLVATEQWPTWCSTAQNVRIITSEKVLGPHSKFRWTTVGVPLESTVAKYVPNERLEYYSDHTDSSGVHAYRAWLLIPVADGCKVISELVERGPIAAYTASTQQRMQSQLTSLVGRGRD